MIGTRPRANRACRSVFDWRHTCRSRRRVQGRSHAPGRWDRKGRADISPLLEAGADPPTPKATEGQEHRVPPPKLAERRRVVVQDTKVLAVVARGADSPLRDGSRESGSLHGRDATPNTLRSAGLGSTPKSTSARLKASVGPNTPEADSQPYGCPEGGLRGTGESPQQGARGSTTHTLYSSLSGIAPHTIIVAEQRGGMEMYIHSI